MRLSAGNTFAIYTFQLAGKGTKQTREILAFLGI